MLIHDRRCWGSGGIIGPKKVRMSEISGKGFSCSGTSADPE